MGCLAIYDALYEARVDAVGAIHVDGLDGLLRAFGAADKTLRDDMKDALQEAAAPVRSAAQAKAVALGRGQGLVADADRRVHVDRVCRPGRTWVCGSGNRVSVRSSAPRLLDTRHATGARGELGRSWNAASKDWSTT